MRASAATLVFLWVATVAACDDTCLFSLDSECDDGGPGSSFFFCDPGTDCSDCNPQEARHGTDASVSSSPSPSPSPTTVRTAASNSAEPCKTRHDPVVTNTHACDGWAGSRW